MTRIKRLFLALFTNRPFVCHELDPEQSNKEIARRACLRKQGTLFTQSGSNFMKLQVHKVKIEGGNLIIEAKLLSEWCYVCPFGIGEIVKLTFSLKEFNFYLRNHIIFIEKLGFRATLIAEEMHI